MLPNPQQCHALASEWINAFNHSLTAAPQSPAATDNLFVADSYWRDALGVTWQLDTMVGGDAIVTALRENATRVGLSDLSLDDTASPPQWVNRAGTDAIEAFFRFETKAAIGRGIVRLCPTTKPTEAGNTDRQWRAWTLFTAIDQLKGHEEKLDRNRPTGSSYSRDFRGPNWLDKARCLVTRNS